MGGTGHGGGVGGGRGGGGGWQLTGRGLDHGSLHNHTLHK